MCTSKLSETSTRQSAATQKVHFSVVDCNSYIEPISRGSLESLQSKNGITLTLLISSKTTLQVLLSMQLNVFVGIKESYQRIANCVPMSSYESILCRLQQCFTGEKLCGTQAVQSCSSLRQIPFASITSPHISAPIPKRLAH